MPTTFFRLDLSNQALKAWQSAHPELAPDRDKPMPTYHVNHDYDKETLTMTTPTQLTPAEQFRADMMSLLDQMRSEIEQMHAEITQIRDGLAHAATVPAVRPQAGATKSFIAVAICHGMDDNGKESYKLRGGPYSKSGVRVWPEVLPALGIAEPVPMGITQLTPPINVLVEMHDYTDPKTHETRVTPYKVIGLA